MSDLAQQREVERLTGALYRVSGARNVEEARGIALQAIRGELHIPAPAEAAARCRLIVDNDGRPS